MRSELVMTFVLFLWLMSGLLAAADVPEREQHERECRENLRIIGEAIKAYRADHNDEMPDWLSDLYPNYLSNEGIMICPADRSVGHLATFEALKDPNMPCSYLYEFSPLKSPFTAPNFEIGEPGQVTVKEQSTLALKYFGDMVPAVRCRHHTAHPRINLSYGGEIYYSKDNWQNSYEADSAFISFVKKAVEENPKSWEKKLSLEKVYNHLDSHKRLPDLRVILGNQSSPSADVLKVLAEIYQTDGNLDKAIECYQKKLKITPDDMESRLRLSQLHTILGNYSAARQQCSRIMRIKSDHPEARSLLIELDAIQEAERVKEKIRETPGEDVEIRYLAKMEEALLTSRENSRQAIRRMNKMGNRSPEQKASNAKLEHIYETLDWFINRDTSRWKTYNNSDGLTNNWVPALAQDDQGILWIGTVKGVCKYNGEKFTHFSISQKFDNDVIYSILIDNQGSIWFGSYKNGAVKYNGEGFVHFNTGNGLPGNFIRYITQDRDGAMWFACNAQGLARYDGKSFTKFSRTDGLAHDYVYSVMEDSQVNLWVGTGDGASKYDGKTFTSLKQSDGLSGKEVWDIAEDRHGNLWFATSKGVTRYDGEKFVSFLEKDGFTSSQIRKILEDREGNIWFVVVANAQKGVFRYDGKTFVNFTAWDGLAGNSVNSILEDREGNIWFGHDNSNGLTMFNPQGIRTYNIQDGLPGNIVQSIAEDESGNLWIATDGGGVVMYDGESFTQPIEDSRRIMGQISGIFADSQNNIWFGTWHNWFAELKGKTEPFNRERGLFRFDGANLTRFTTLDGLVWNNTPWGGSITEDSSGNIWVGAMGGSGSAAGVSIYDGKRFRNLTMADGLANDDVCGGIIEDRDKNIWIGTWSGGIMKYDGTDFTHFTVDHGLVSNYVQSIAIDNLDRLWIGTMDGVSIYDGKSFHTPEQFKGYYIQALTRDRDGYMWLGTSTGGVIRTDGEIYTQITKDDGLPERSVFSICQDKDGDIWIGTWSGIARYTPSSVKPLIHMKSVSADREYQDFSSISIPSEAGYVRFSYQGVSFRTRPGVMQYLYQLQGHDDDWQEPTHERNVEYMDLKPGEYTFMVKAIDMDLNHSEPVSLPVEILRPPFHRTGMFLLVLSIVGGGSLLVAIFLSVHRLRTSHAERLRLQNELEDARQMQTRLLPESAPHIEGFDVAGFSRPAREVGGDFFDYLSLGDSKTGIALADASGKGLRGAMNAVLANGMLHEASKVEASCSRILSSLNAALYPRIEKQMFTALSLAVLNQEAGGLNWSSAAQPAPLLKRSGEVSELEGDSGLPLGMMPELAYPEHDFQLRSGDILLLYTDGIIEAENGSGEMYGSERLESFLSKTDSTMTADEIIQAVLGDITGFTGGAEQYDDMTMVVLKKV